jgi:hypothetical protein
METWLYVLACVAVPCAIGGTMYVLFGLWNRRRSAKNPEHALPPIDYMI